MVYIQIGHLYEMFVHWYFLFYVCRHIGYLLHVDGNVSLIDVPFE